MMIGLGLYYLIGIGSVIFSLCNKNKPKEWLYYLFLVLYGGFGVHQFYAKNLPRASSRLTAGLVNLPFFLLFINGLFRVLADGYDDPAYGLIFVGVLGGILPTLVIIILCVLDLAGMKSNEKVEDGENHLKIKTKHKAGLRFKRLVIRTAHLAGRRMESDIRRLVK